LSQKVLAYADVSIRGAMGRDNPPLIVSIPREIATVAKLTKGNRIKYLQMARVSQAARKT
jgi:hypothetical protein